LYFVYAASYLLSLHSFPTRRSSDLYNLHARRPSPRGRRSETSARRGRAKMRRLRQTVLCTVAALAALVASIPVPSHADGGGGGDATSSRVVRLKPVDPDYTKATKAIKAGDFAAAIPLLERVVARDSTD